VINDTGSRSADLSFSNRLIGSLPSSYFCRWTTA
jgi:hypothetical protein